MPIPSASPSRLNVGSIPSLPTNQDGRDLPIEVRNLWKYALSDVRPGDVVESEQIKRTNRSRRRMRWRLLMPGEFRGRRRRGWDLEDYGVLPVVDLDLGKPRGVTLENILAMNHKGRHLRRTPGSRPVMPLDSTRFAKNATAPGRYYPRGRRPEDVGTSNATSPVRPFDIKGTTSPTAGKLSHDAFRRAGGHKPATSGGLKPKNFDVRATPDEFSESDSTQSTFVILRLPKYAAENYPHKPQDSSPPHITLLYVGKQSIKAATELAREVDSWLKDFEPVQAIGRGRETFPAGPDGIPVYTPVIEDNGSASTLQGLRDKVRRAADRAGIEWTDTHKEFVPHVTIAYAENEDEVLSIAPPDEWFATLDRVEVRHGSSCVGITPLYRKRDGSHPPVLKYLDSATSVSTFDEQFADGGNPMLRAIMRLIGVSGGPRRPASRLNARQRMIRETDRQLYGSGMRGRIMRAIDPGMKLTSTRQSPEEERSDRWDRNRMTRTRRQLGEAQGRRRQLRDETMRRNSASIPSEDYFPPLKIAASSPKRKIAASLPREDDDFPALNVKRQRDLSPRTMNNPRLLEIAMSKRRLQRGTEAGDAFDDLQGRNQAEMRFGRAMDRLDPADRIEPQRQERAPRSVERNEDQPLPSRQMTPREAANAFPQRRRSLRSISPSTRSVPRDASAGRVRGVNARGNVSDDLRRSFFPDVDSFPRQQLAQKRQRRPDVMQLLARRRRRSAGGVGLLAGIRAGRYLGQGGKRLRAKQGARLSSRIGHGIGRLSRAIGFEHDDPQADDGALIYSRRSRSADFSHSPAVTANEASFSAAGTSRAAGALTHFFPGRRGRRNRSNAA